MSRLVRCSEPHHVGATVFGAALPAAAHASVLRSDLQPNAVLDAALSVVRLTFSEPINGCLSSIELTVGEVTVEGATTATDGADLSVLVVALPGGIGADVDSSSVTFAAPTVGTDGVDGIMRRRLTLAALQRRECVARCALECGDRSSLLSDLSGRV